MTDKRICAPFGTWASTIDAEVLVDRPPPPRYPMCHEEILYWLEARPREGGRIVLQRRDADGTEHCVTPAGFSIRTRVHEYGGRCFVIGNSTVYFCNDNDQRIYSQSLTSTTAPVPLTPAQFADDCHGRYADLTLSPDGRWLFCVMEREGKGAQPESAIVAVLASPISTEHVVEPLVLERGQDFYAEPRLSPDGRRLAWLQWRHPYMPWDQSEACLAELVQRNETLELAHRVVVAGGYGQSVCQLGFSADGDLLFARDEDGASGGAGDFWNLYIFRNGSITSLTEDLHEYGAPHWVFGVYRHAILGKDSLISVRSDVNGDELVRVDPDGGGAEPLSMLALERYNQYGDLWPSGPGAVVLTASGPQLDPVVLKVTEKTAEVIKSFEPFLSPANISVAEAISYPTYDGEQAHAYFYPPVNQRFHAPDDQKPPLLVMVHGGPTARAMPSFDLGRQYWTNRGFAVLDVNHRGSTGYGRRYRQSLLGYWGVKDAADVAAGVEYLVKQGKVQSGKICIRGGSAGGYVVLTVLTEYGHLFSAGACYYGIGNLATLAESTHKFELKYTDRLIGEEYDPQRASRTDSRYYQRSPVHFMGKLSCPMIVFQGADDKVVPPALALELVAALKERGVEHEYVEYPGEGHGFRRSETNIDARKRESAFFMKVLGLKQPGTTDG